MVETELPLPERTLRLPEALGLALAGATPDLPGIEVLDGPGPALPDSLRFEARRLAALLQRGAGRVVAVRAGSNAEARQAAQAIAMALARTAALIDPARLPTGLGPLCRLLGWLPALKMRLGPGERQIVPRLRGYEGPRLALLGPDGQLEDTGELLDWTVPLPSAAERAALWHGELHDAALAERLGRTQLQGSTRIRAVGRRARLNAELGGQPAPGADEVRQAALAEARGGLDALAQPIVDHVPDAALVVPERLQADLALLGERCCRRDGLAAGLGAALQARYRARRARAVHRALGHRQDARLRLAREPPRPAALPRRPRRRDQQVHRRDREEPRRSCWRAPRRRMSCCCSTRPTRCSASAPRSRTPTTASPTARPTTCCSGSRPMTASCC